MNFKQLEAFYWLSQIQNYRQTAQRLGLTQPAVSARIQSLENDLGKTLIDRTAPSFRLTDQGIEVADFALQFLNLRETMNTRLLDKHKQRLAIGLAGMAALTWGPVLLQRVRDDHPELTLDVYSSSDLQLARFIDAGTLDLAFTASGDRVPEAEFTTRFAVGWVARPDLVEGVPQPMTPEALRNLPLVLYPKTSPMWNPVAEIIEEMRSQRGARHYGNSLATMYEMLRLGYGASALALIGVEEELADGRLVQLSVTDEIPPLDLACTYANRARRKQVRLVLDLARECAEEWCRNHPRHATFIEGV
ncbi:MAG: LysR family transcriptional regulator [Sagittula sp.]|jgi:DNA-binding transcriptional LysR family regulator|uniref:LysR family transcriptional regulator n=1 Tax=Roseobacteraceae TaxID=2854170 RepID=UPI00351197CE